MMRMRPGAWLPAPVGRGSPRPSPRRRGVSEFSKRRVRIWITAFCLITPGRPGSGCRKRFFAKGSLSRRSWSCSPVLAGARGIRSCSHGLPRTCSLGFTPRSAQGMTTIPVAYRVRGRAPAEGQGQGRRHFRGHGGRLRSLGGGAYAGVSGHRAQTV